MKLKIETSRADRDTGLFVDASHVEIEADTIEQIAQLLELSRSKTIEGMMNANVKNYKNEQSEVV